MRYSYIREAAARTMSGHIVMIPDEVAREQWHYDKTGKSFTVVRRDGTKARAVLKGEEYGLYSVGTGVPVVRIVQAVIWLCYVSVAILIIIILKGIDMNISQLIIKHFNADRVLIDGDRFKINNTLDSIIIERYKKGYTMKINSLYVTTLCCRKVFSSVEKMAIYYRKQQISLLLYGYIIVQYSHFIIIIFRGTLLWPI